jgi:hypothetical protein
MIVASGGSISTYFTTNDADGASFDATGTPTGVLYVNGSANGATVTVTNISTGLYKAAVTAPAGSSGDHLVLIISATVDGTATKAKVWEANQSQLVLSAAQVNAEVDTALTDWGKTGFSLASTGLDLCVMTEPADEAGWGDSVVVGIAHLAAIAGHINKTYVTRTSSTAGTLTVRNFADDATLWTHALTDDGTISTVGKAT